MIFGLGGCERSLLAVLYSGLVLNSDAGVSSPSSSIFMSLLAVLWNGFILILVLLLLPLFSLRGIGYCGLSFRFWKLLIFVIIIMIYSQLSHLKY